MKIGVYMGRMCNPPHPGEIIKEILLLGAGLTTAQLADLLQVTRGTISRIINKHSGISADMALRLSKLLPDTSVELWLSHQQAYDVWQIKQHSKELNIKPLKVA